jgi:hypothetical protein
MSKEDGAIRRVPCVVLRRVSPGYGKAPLHHALYGLIENRKGDAAGFRPKPGTQNHLLRCRKADTRFGRQPLGPDPSMTTPQKNPLQYGLLSMAVLAAIGGGVIAFTASSFTIQTIGLILLPIGVSLGRFARSNDPINQIAARSAAPNRPGPILWTVAIASALATVIALHYLYQDAIRGYHQVLPVYAFAAVALICGSVWAALLARLVQ